MSSENDAKSEIILNNTEIVKNEITSQQPNLKPVQNPCSVCNKILPFMKTCGKCNIRKYCSKECQIKDWKLHKISCKPIKKESSPMIKSSQIEEIQETKEKIPVESVQKKENSPMVKSSQVEEIQETKEEKSVESSLKKEITVESSQKEEKSAESSQKEEKSIEPSQEEEQPNLLILAPKEWLSDPDFNAQTGIVISLEKMNEIFKTKEFELIEVLDFGKRLKNTKEKDPKKSIVNHICYHYYYVCHIGKKSALHHIMYEFDNLYLRNKFMNNFYEFMSESALNNWKKEKVDKKKVDKKKYENFSYATANIGEPYKYPVSIITFSKERIIHKILFSNEDKNFIESLIFEISNYINENAKNKIYSPEK